MTTKNCCQACRKRAAPLTYSAIKEIMVGIAEFEQGEFSEYQFG